ADVTLLAGPFDVQLFEDAVLQDGNAALLRLEDVDEHLFLHGSRSLSRSVRAPAPRRGWAGVIAWIVWVRAAARGPTRRVGDVRNRVVSRLRGDGSRTMCAARRRPRREAVRSEPAEAGSGLA